MRDVIVVDADPTWPAAFDALATELRAALGPVAVRIHHIGSTSVAQLAAKPIIDVLLEVTDLAALDACHAALEMRDWQVMGEYGIPRRRYYRRDDAAGVRRHHLHAFAAGDEHVQRHLAFRDYLRTHAEQARAYAELKRRLAAAHSHDIQAYMDGKDAFVQAAEQRALAWYRQQ